MKRSKYLAIILLCIASNSAFAQWGPAPTESQWAKPSEPAPQPTAPEEIPTPTSPPLFGGTTSPTAPTQPVVTTIPPPTNGAGQPSQSQWSSGSVWGSPTAPAPIPAPAAPTTSGGWQPGQSQWGNPTALPAPATGASPPTINDGWRPGQSQWGNQETAQPPPLVQVGGRNDTLGTGATPNTSSNLLSVPRLLAPTNPGELAPTIPLEWSPVAGATYYQLAVRNLTTNELVVDRNVSGTSYVAPPYQVGVSFRWNVAACNQQGCSNRSISWSFRTAARSTTATVPTTTLTYEDVMSPRERGIFDEHFTYLSRIPESNPPQRFTPDHIRRMQDGGRWQGYILGIETDNQTLRQIDKDPPHFCGSQGGARFPDGILLTDIYPACRTHDACYASAATQAQCDIGIRRDIISICRVRNSSPICYIAADSYYLGLKWRGSAAYNNAQSTRQNSSN